jgi:hypothetical protein
MIATDQLDYILECAYIPEQMTSYVTAISTAEPFLFGNFLVYRKQEHVVFVGYPLREDFQEIRMKKALDEVVRRFNPSGVTLMAPSIPTSIHPQTPPSTDQYYRLDLASLSVSQKVRNMINRAKRNLKVEKQKTLDEGHRKLVREFLTAYPVGQETRFIFERIPDYVSSSATAWVYDARDEKGELVAFDVAEMGPKHYAFYMFNFTSHNRVVPGASDLLLWEILLQAKREGKHYINLGLGINPGVSFFKEKWGGVPFLPYSSCSYELPSVERLETLLQKL